jgi:hypothetical protein
LLSEAYVKVLSADFLSALLGIFPLPFSLQQFFSLPKASHTKRPKVKASSQYSKAKSPPEQKAKSQAKSPKAQSKAPKGKRPSSSFRGLL